MKAKSINIRKSNLSAIIPKTDEQKLIEQKALKKSRFPMSKFQIQNHDHSKDDVVKKDQVVGEEQISESASAFPDQSMDQSLSISRNHDIEDMPFKPEKIKFERNVNEIGRLYGFSRNKTRNISNDTTFT